MNKSESIAHLATAMSLFQGEVRQPLKDKNNPFFKSKYCPLENVVEVINETAVKHGLSFMQYPINQESKVGIVTLVMHKSGEFIEFDPIFATPTKNDPQGVGSTITYLKRYSLSAIFGITSDEDDDGNSASNTNQGGQVNQQPQQQQNSYNGTIKMPTNAQEAGSIVLSFGKHQGKSLGVIWREDMQYIQWLVNSDKTDPAIREGIGMMQVAAAQKQAQQKMNNE